MVKCLTICVALLTVLPWSSVGSAREWTSSDGKYAVEADLVGVDGSKVRLKKKNGKIVSIPLQRLSREDRAYLSSLQRPETRHQSPTDAPELRNILTDKGLRLTRSGLSLVDEVKLGKQLRQTARLRKTLRHADRGLNTILQTQQKNNRSMDALTRVSVQLNTQLANVPENNVKLHNKLVGAINSNVGQMKLLRQQAKPIAEEVRRARQEMNDAREKYVQHILDMRALANTLQQQYQQAASDKKLQTLLKAANVFPDGSQSLTRSKSFRSALRQLEKLEDTVLTEEIPLRVTSGGTLYVTVVIDGQHTQEMVLDSGASLISLPQTVAQKCQVEVKPDDPTIVLELADGSRIEGKRVTIPTVRVGQFTAENVDCAVLGPEASGAEPLLGMSFLGRFQFQVDAQERTLSMFQVQTE